MSSRAWKFYAIFVWVIVAGQITAGIALGSPIMYVYAAACAVCAAGGTIMARSKAARGE